MQTVSRTPDQLILANKPWLLGLSMIVLILIFVGLGLFLMTSGDIVPGILFALIGGGGGAIAFMAAARRTQLVLDVATDTVTLRTRSVLGFTEKQYRLSDVDAAFLEAPQNSDSKGMFRPVLAMKDGTEPAQVPVLLAYISGRGPKRATDTINDWLARRAPVFPTRKD